MLRADGRNVLVVGGGTVALRRAGTFAEAGAEVTVVAPETNRAGEIPGCEVMQRKYRTEDAAGRWLVVAATDDPAVNAQVVKDAQAAGALVNRADDPQDGDVIVPAHGRAGPITLAVGTDGISAAAGAAIRDQLLATLDGDWARLLNIAVDYRRRIQQKITDPAQRRDLLRRLVDTEALALLKNEGEPALRQRCESLIGKAQP